MSAELLVGLIFIAAAIISKNIIDASDAGVFDMIIIRLNNYIVKRIERLEGKDI